MQPSDETSEDEFAVQLLELDAEGIGEGDFDEEGHGVPADLLELYEILEAKEAGL